MKAEFQRFLDFLFPPRCAGCGRRGVELCDGCLESIRAVPPGSCPRCGRISKLGSLCPSCRAYSGPLEGIRTACIYEGVARKAIHGLKYRHRETLALPLASLLVAELTRRPLRLDLLVAVPLHPRRLAERGYNQSELIARELGAHLEIPVVRCLERKRETRVQAELKRPDRQANVRGAFAYSGALDVTGRRVGIVDDVCTTASTLEECAHALKEAGCATAWGIAVARDL